MSQADDHAEHTHDTADGDTVVWYEPTTKAPARGMLVWLEGLIRDRAAALGTAADPADQPVIGLIDDYLTVRTEPTGSAPSMTDLMPRILSAARSSRLVLDKSCPVCGAAPRWAEDGMAGCFACPTTSSGPPGSHEPHEPRQPHRRRANGDRPTG